jgi:hypothetical protein
MYNKNFLFKHLYHYLVFSNQEAGATVVSHLAELDLAF